MGCCGDSDAVREEKEMKGPIKNRHCTDVIMLLVFLAFCCGMVAIASLSLKAGDPRRIIYGTDSWGNLCGRKNDPAINATNAGLDLTDFPFLYYTNPTDFDAFRLCVAECPNQNIADCTASQAACQAEGVCLATNNPYTITSKQREQREDRGETLNKI